MPKRKTSRPIIIGVCGRSCSGKSTVSRIIASNNPADILHIEADHFARAVTPHRFNGHENVDHPSSIKFEKLIRAIRLLKAGKTVRIPEKRGQKKHTLTVRPRKTIIVEGFLIFSNEELVGLFDKKLFIDVSDETIRVRRLTRNRHPKYDKEDYIENVVIPASKLYDSLQRSNADLVIDGNDSHQYVIHKIREQIQV